MGKTIYEKIIERVSGKRNVNPGEIVWVTPDLIATTDLNWCHRETFLDKVGLDTVPKPKKIVAVVDHLTEQSSQPEGAKHLQAFRTWAKKNVGVHFYDTGRGGLQNQVLIEKGHVWPGMMLVGDDPEGEACGALGVYAKTYDQNMWMAIAIDKTWLEVLEVIKYILKGDFRKVSLALT